jgi:hypothetical protein
MRYLICAIIILIVGAGYILESRYALVVDSPVVAKLDKFTGDVWIVNSGVWRKIQLPENGSQEKAVIETKAAQTK